jgi:hypothetical protein
MVIELLSKARAKWMMDKDTTALAGAVSDAIQILEKANEPDGLKEMSSPKLSKKNKKASKT